MSDFDEMSDEEFSALVDPDIPRTDMVGKAANGTRWFIAKGAQPEGGLFAPDFVRGLIAKGDGDEPFGDWLKYATLAEAYGWLPSQVDALTPSQRAMALVHAASLRKAEMSTGSVNDLPDSDFAYIEPGGKKDESGKTVPRSKRHFPIHDAAHVRNALSRAPQSPFGDQAMPKIRAAAKKFGIEVAKAGDMTDDLDPTAVLAEPDGDVPGDPNDPGSPAWEAIDAASARKWTALLVRARNALCALAEREGIEAMAGNDDDLFAALDLQQASCCIDEAVGILARFAVDEQAESDFGAEEMEAVGKAMAGFDAAALETLEGFAPVVKAGRVLSSANETALRTAVDALQKVLASLPAPTPDDGQPVAKTTKEAAVTVEAKLSAGEYALSKDAVQAAATAPLAKAKGKPMFVVCDANGKPVGVCDPDDIMPIADMGGTGDTEASDAEPAPDGGDAADEGAVIPGTQTVASPAPADDEDVAKSAAQAGMVAALKEVLTPLTDELAKHAELAGVVKSLEERFNNLAKLPDDRKSPLLNGTGIPGAPVPTGELSELAQLRKAIDDAPAGPERDAANAQYAYAKIKDLFMPHG